MENLAHFFSIQKSSSNTRMNAVLFGLEGIVDLKTNFFMREEHYIYPPQPQ